MAETKRYYWLRLHDDFFQSKRIKKLRKLAGGDTYTIIYLKMQLLSIKKDGQLEYTQLEPTFAEEIALDIDESPEDVQVTINYLFSCGLMETNDETNYFLPYAIENTGSETSVAQRVRDYREKQKMLHCNTDVTQVKQICNGEIEIEIEKEIDNKKKILKKECLHLGTFSNVKLTAEEYEKLKQKYPTSYEDKIDKLSMYISSKGDKYKSHYATILNWTRKEEDESRSKEPSRELGYAIPTGKVYR